MRNILVANRGEIAWRIMRSARALGYRVSAVYSSADSASPHVTFADSAVCIGPAPVGASYLNIERIVAAARSLGADAVHPGYGLLSENADFAQACNDAGLTFIGPRPETIRSMGNKRLARRAVQGHGVACVPGYDGDDQRDATLVREAARVGFPIMVKAAAGGGGRGMRRVNDPAALPEALTRARSEAEKAFADGRLILERAIDGARHVEVQIFADSHGHVLQLGERDCSVQRRFQKLIEESPSPAVDADLRRRMGDVAVLVAKSANYLGAGTVELLLEPSGDFYFLEMNTRLQVEHPVTELVTGLDLVAWQLLVAEGAALPLQQADIALQGHAIEVRLYAEEPERGFVPATGKVQLLSIPSQHVRVDHTLVEGLVIGSHYDALLGKLIAHGADREQARRRLLSALRELRVLGVPTNQAFLQDVLAHETFIAGQATTDFLTLHPSAAVPVAPSPATLAAAALLFCTRETVVPAAYAPELAHFSNCAGLAFPLVLECGEQRSTLSVTRDARTGAFEVRIDNSVITAQIERSTPHTSELTLDGLRQRYDHAFDGERLFVHTPSGPHSFLDVTHAAARVGDEAGSGHALAPMDGCVVEVLVQPGDQVERGQTLIVVEAMKLELRVPADLAGVVGAVHVARGAQVKARQLLVEVSAPTALS
jgi:geranyl-CoA carboxylase alpha subunit